MVEGVTLAGIAGVVENLLRENKKLYVETIEAGDGFLIQAREEGKLKTFTGMGFQPRSRLFPWVETMSLSMWAQASGSTRQGLLQ